MATFTFFSSHHSSVAISPSKPNQTLFSSPSLSSLRPLETPRTLTLRNLRSRKSDRAIRIPGTIAAGLIGAGLGLAMVGPASGVEFSLLGSSLRLSEPANALSLPTWAIHVSSVVEWITAMILVWQYGEKSGFESWKGLSWGMVPLLGGAFCACTWHFFYNSESLEILVAIQAALTVIGNATMCIAAFRIYKSSPENTKNL